MYDINIHIHHDVHIYISCCVKLPQLCLTLCEQWTLAHQALLSMGFSRHMLPDFRDTHSKY